MKKPGAILSDYFFGGEKLFTMINLQNSSQTLFESKNPLFPSIPFKFGEDSHFEPYFSIFGWNHQLLDDRIFGASILRSSGRGGSRHGLESATTSAGAERDELGSWGGPETTVKISGWVVPVFVGCLEFDTTEAGVKFGWLSLGTPKIEWEWQSALFFEFCELLQMRLFKDLRFSDYTHRYPMLYDFRFCCPPLLWLLWKGFFTSVFFQDLELDVG